ncbi:MAG TPA: response regulator transcription factor [Candidatus Baltobacteraceae bacterium]|nr:response regulator transcription factor [Candidatus Baltobacteraceae bacterium]
MAKRVLVVEDEPEIRDVLEDYLRKETYDAAGAGTVEAALAEIEQRPPDLVLLDIGLPDGSGFDVLRKTNELRRIPTIVLTTRSEEVDRIVGLELGADDYIAKPFSPREVIARIRALFRRLDAVAATAELPGAVHRVRDLEINEAAHEVRVQGKVIEVRPAEFRILALLARHAGQVLSRPQMLDLLHDDGSIFERTLDRHINHLRHKIEPNPETPTYLVTVYGVGYKLDPGT